jgi:hypothetical protein
VNIVGEETAKVEEEMFNGWVIHSSVSKTWSVTVNVYLYNEKMR